MEIKELLTATTTTPLPLTTRTAATRTTATYRTTAFAGVGGAALVGGERFSFAFCGREALDCYYDYPSATHYQH